MKIFIKNVKNWTSRLFVMVNEQLHPKIYIITGISSDKNWYRILLDDDESWVAVERVTILYDTGGIPIVE